MNIYIDNKTCRISFIKTLDFDNYSISYIIGITTDIGDYIVCEDAQTTNIIPKTSISLIEVLKDIIPDKHNINKNAKIDFGTKIT